MLATSAVALAQPAAPLPPPKPPAGTLPTLPSPYGAPLPHREPPDDPIEPPIVEPLPAYSPMYQPTTPAPPYALSPPEPSTFRARRTGATVEANVGPGLLRVTGNQETDNSEVGFGGALGIGGWISNDLALELRGSALKVEQDHLGITNAFVGLDVQGWITDHAWLGGGAGLAVLSLSNATFVGTNESRDLGVGIDLRAGYNFITTGVNTFNLSIDIAPSFYTERGVSLTVASVSLLLGYQLI